jgi:hypothetical protein
MSPLHLRVATRCGIERVHASGRQRAPSCKDRIPIASHSPSGNLQTGLPVIPPEKAAAELACWIQQDAFAESGLSAKDAGLRDYGDLPRFSEKEKSRREFVAILWQ